MGGHATLGHHQPDMLLQMADCYVRLDRLEEAERTYHEVLPEALDPEQAETALGGDVLEVVAGVDPARRREPDAVAEDRGPHRALQIAREGHRLPSTLLMPVAFGSLLGGLMTLIGTPPNILSGQLLQERGLRKGQEDNHRGRVIEFRDVKVTGRLLLELAGSDATLCGIEVLEKGASEIRR